jgi:hypothetical protein
MSRARKLQHLFMVMHVKPLESADLVRELRDIFDVEVDEPDRALIINLKAVCDIHEQAEDVNRELLELSSKLSSVRFHL